MSKVKIKILRNGPYVVTGGVPLSEKIITPHEGGYIYTEGRPLPQAQTYTLCRCGRTKAAPFCDGAHVKDGFKCEETAENTPYIQRAELIKGPGLDMLDDHRCALARFCHRKSGDAWELVEQSGDPCLRGEAVAAASECPAGRLTAVTKDGRHIEPSYEPAIEILQDPEEGASCGIFVKGYIPIENAEGVEYEPRNRVVLCRCGHSKIKPFCDGAHLDVGFVDTE